VRGGGRTFVRGGGMTFVRAQHLPHRRGHVAPPMGTLHHLYRAHSNGLVVALVARVCGCSFVRLNVSLPVIALRLCRLPDV
jgi:hypothetical protein